MELPLGIWLETLSRVERSEGVQAPKRCFLGAAGPPTGLQEGLWLRLQTAEERWALQPPSFHLKHPMSPEGLAPFWILMGKCNWVFSVLLCCVWGEVLKRLWVASSLCFAFWSSWAWMFSLVRVFHSQSHDCSLVKSSSAPLPPTGLMPCGREVRDSVWNGTAGWAESMPQTPGGEEEACFLPASVKREVLVGRPPPSCAILHKCSFKCSTAIMYSCVRCWKEKMDRYVPICHFSQWFENVGAELI